MAHTIDDILARLRELSGGDDDVAVNALVEALDDPRPRVAKEARRTLGEHFVVRRQRLLRLLCATRRPHTRVQVVALLARGERTDSILSLLDASTLADPLIAGEACRHLARWGDVWAPLPVDRAREVIRAIEDALPSLPNLLAARFAAYVRHLRGEPPLPWRASTPVVRPARVVRRRNWWSQRTVRRRYELPPRWPAPWTPWRRD